MREPMETSCAMCVAAGLALALGACSESTSPGEASLSLRITDAPGDVSRAWVEITEIRLQGESDAGPGGVTLTSGSTGMIELTDLVDRTEELVADVSVPSGTYGQLRLVIGAAALETEGGAVFSKGGGAEELDLEATGNLVCPSCEQTGIKVDLPGGSLTLESASRVLVLDFDVDQTFGHQAGASGNWVMHPLVRTSSLEASGTIVGTVSLAEGVDIPPCGGEDRSIDDFVTLALDPDTGDTVATGEVESDGSHSIDFLEPGDYEIGFEREIVFENGDVLVFDATTPGPVSVESGAEVTADVTADVTVDEATCQSPSS